MAKKPLGKTRVFECNGIDIEFNINSTSCNDLRTMLDANQYRIVSLRDVFYGVARLANFPHHTTQFDFNRFVRPVLDELVDRIEAESVTAFWLAKGAGRNWDEYYVYAQDLLHFVDVGSMPDKDNFVCESYRSAHKKNVEPDGYQHILDLRRKFLVAIGDAPNAYDHVKSGEIVRYVKRTPEEEIEHEREMHKLAEKRKPITDGRKVYPWAMEFWARLEKYGINPSNDSDEPKRQDDHDPYL